MVSFKQLQALYWICELGTFEKAAVRLNTTQSAISKRIQELETVTGITIFIRNNRQAQLTEKGELLLETAREAIEMIDKIASIRNDDHAIVRKMRIGVTELSLLTWLPKFVSLVSHTYPTLIIEPQVESARRLHEQLVEGDIDLAIMPDVMPQINLTSVRIAEVQNVWMGRPGLVEEGKVLTAEDLAQYSILSQGMESGTGLFYHQWMNAEGIHFNKKISTNSMLAIAGLTIAGVGISYLPHECLKMLIKIGKLTVIPTDPVLPPVPYAAIYRGEQPSEILRSVISLLRQSCNFSSLLQE